VPEQERAREQARAQGPVPEPAQGPVPEPAQGPVPERAQALVQALVQAPDPDRAHVPVLSPTALAEKPSGPAPW